MKQKLTEMAYERQDLQKKNDTYSKMYQRSR